MRRNTSAAARMSCLSKSGGVCGTRNPRAIHPVDEANKVSFKDRVSAMVISRSSGREGGMEAQKSRRGYYTSPTPVARARTAMMS